MILLINLSSQTMSIKEKAKNNKTININSCSTSSKGKAGYLGGRRESQMKETEQVLEGALLQTRKIAHETIAIGAATLEELKGHEEVLDSTEETLDMTEFVARQATRVIRGMTWGGMLYNIFTSDPVLQNKPLSKKEKNLIVSNNANKKVDFFDNDLDDISKALDQMRSIGEAMGTSLEQQKQTIARIDRKSNIVHNSLMLLTIRAGQLMRGGSKPWVELGVMEMIDLKSCRYFAVDDTTADNTGLVLTHRHDTSSQWRVYTTGTLPSRQNYDVIALRNVKTLRFIRITLTGNVAVAGEVPEYPEELFFDIEGVKPTGMLLMRRNWGNGGWLKCPYTNSDPNRGLDDSILNITSTSIHDHENTLLFLPKWLP